MTNRFVVPLDSVQKCIDLGKIICEEISLNNDEILLGQQTKDWLKSHGCIEENDPKTHLISLIFESEENMIAFMLKYL